MQPGSRRRGVSEHMKPPQLCDVGNWWEAGALTSQTQFSAFMTQSSKRLLTLKLSQSPRPAEPRLGPEALLAWLIVPGSIGGKPPHKESLSSESSVMLTSRVLEHFKLFSFKDFV